MDSEILNLTYEIEHSKKVPVGQEIEFLFSFGGEYRHKGK